MRGDLASAHLGLIFEMLKMLILQRSSDVKERACHRLVVVTGDDGRSIRCEFRDALENILWCVRREVSDQLVVDREVWRKHEEVVDAVRQVEVADEAPIRRVLPTPVARAKQRDGNSRSKLVTDGNSARIAARAASTSTSFRGGRDLRHAVQYFERLALRRRRLKRPAMAFT